MFIEISDLETVIPNNRIAELTNTDDTIINKIISECIDEFKGLMPEVYDAQEIFSQTGDNRNKTVLAKLKEIVAYKLYSRQGFEVSEVVFANYERAVSFFENLNKSKIKVSELPIVLDTKTSTFLGKSKKYEPFTI